MLRKSRFIEIKKKYSYLNKEYLDYFVKQVFAGGDKPQDMVKIATSQFKYPVYANGVEKEGLQGFTQHPKVLDSAVTVSARGTIGATFIRKEPFTPIVRLITLIPNDKVNLIYLKNEIDESDIKSSGSSQQQLTVPQIKQIKLQPIPKYEQDNLEIEINQIDKLKFILQQKIEKLELLKKSRFIEMFGSYNLALKDKSWVKIKSIGTVVSGSTPKTKESTFWNGNFYWVTPAELDDQPYIYKTYKTLTLKGVNSCSLKELPKGTVLLTSRAPIGKVAITGSKMYCNQGFKNIICSSKILPRFLFFILQQNSNYLNQLGRGATFREISKNIVEDILIPVPEIEPQTAYVNFIDQIDKLKLIAQKQLDFLVGQENK